MSLDDLDARLRAAFPGADIAIDDLAGDGDHYKARIVSAAFAGLNRVRQHQLVYAALGGRMGGELHALALETTRALNRPGALPSSRFRKRRTELA